MKKISPFVLHLKVQGSRTLISSYSQGLKNCHRLTAVIDNWAVKLILLMDFFGPRVFIML